MSEYETKCCNRSFSAKRFEVKPYIGDVEKESYKKATCPVCEQLIVERVRVFKKQGNTTHKKRHRLIGLEAREYLFLLNYRNIEVKEIINKEVEKGCKSNINWTYGENNSIKNFNDKTVGSRITNPINTIKGEFAPEQSLITA